MKMNGVKREENIVSVVTSVKMKESRRCETEEVPVESQKVRSQR